MKLKVPFTCVANYPHKQSRLNKQKDPNVGTVGQNHNIAFLFKSTSLCLS